MELTATHCFNTSCLHSAADHSKDWAGVLTYGRHVCACMCVGRDLLYPFQEEVIILHAAVKSELLYFRTFLFAHMRSWSDLEAEVWAAEGL